MARGAVSPPPTTLLPKVSFTKIVDESLQPVGVADHQARSYGYNDGSDFKRPEHYIRYIEPLESELAVQVEYDMDEQDREWLELVNNERRKEQLDKVSYELFEIAMDRLEKEWFDLTKNVPKPDLAMPSEDSTCAICDDSEGENTNAIVFCDGCNLAVHQDCYGVPYIPEGQWLCRKCTVSPENPVSCILCPNEGGAFKQTVHGEWVHLLCAIWVPETRVANDVFMEPVTGVDKISKQRWKLRCSICDVREGACIQCIKSSCFTAFHATCARKEKLLMPMKATQGSEAPVLACYCEKHLPREQAEARLLALEAELNQGGDAEMQKSSKTARAYAKTYKPGPPLVPKIIVDRIMAYIGKVSLRQKREFIILVCKYWSLKREARRGAPLLKRLHLEPWTASTGGRNQSDEDKQKKIELLTRLRNDLGALREIADLVKKREVQKLLQVRAVHNFISRTLLPWQEPLRTAFERVVSFDRQEFFRNPVSKYEVPDYYDVIKRPICWNTIEKRLESYHYIDIQSFKDDINLVLDNAMLYNRPDTQYWKTAQRIKSHAEKILAELDQLKVEHPELGPIPPLDESEDAYSSRRPLGDLEPPVEVVEMLVSDTDIKDDLNFVMDTEPIKALLSYELPQDKPPPPQQTNKRKRDRKAERERIRQMRAIEAASTSRARTRSAVAAETSSVGASASMDIDDVDVEGEEHEPSQSEVEKKKSKKGKRAPLVLPGQAEVPPVVDAVDNQRMFTMFDAGWILPDGHRRGGRIATERQPIEPRRKKPRIEPTVEREKSHFSTDGTAVGPDDGIPDDSVVLADDNQQPSHELSIEDDLRYPSPEPELEQTDMEVNNLAEDNAHDDQMEIDPPDTQPPHDTFQTEEVGEDDVAPANPVLSSRADTPSEARVAAELIDMPEPLSAEENSLASEPNISASNEDASTPPPPTPPPTSNKGNKERRHVIIIEELDTPAIRREKNQRKKAERAERLRRESMAAALQSEQDDQPGTSTSRVNVEEPSSSVSATGDAISVSGNDLDANSDLTSLSGLSEEDDQAAEGSESPTVADGTLESEEDRGKVVLEKGKMLEEGTLVWAKTKTYPWWPAVVCDVGDPDAPEDLLETITPQKARKEQLHLIRFYDGKQDAHDSWNYVALDALKLFGEDPILDQDMIAAKSKRQRWKHARMRELCRRAYRRATGEMDVPAHDGQTTA